MRRFEIEIPIGGHASRRYEERRKRQGEGEGGAGGYETLSCGCGDAVERGGGGGKVCGGVEARISGGGSFRGMCGGGILGGERRLLEEGGVEVGGEKAEGLTCRLWMGLVGVQGGLRLKWLEREEGREGWFWRLWIEWWVVEKDGGVGAGSKF